MRYGIRDSEGACWIGNEQGPLLYDEQLDASLAASILNERMGRESFRFYPREFSPGPMRLKDTFKPKLSFDEAMGGSSADDK